MKKRLFIIFGCFALISFSGKAQNHADKAPNTNQSFTNNSHKTEAIWDIQKDFDLTSAASGTLSMAGVLFFNNEYWVSIWDTDTIIRFDAAGVLIDRFVVTGVTGIRSFSTDGTTIFAANNTNKIYRIDPATRQLDNAQPQILLYPITLDARFCAYDPTLDNGNGGFWIGSFDTDITAVGMAGNTLSTIPLATFGNLDGIYGAAVDYFTAGGPYLWVFNQGGSNDCDLIQLSLPTGTPTGVMHDVYPDISTTHSLTYALAGGAFITPEIVSGKASLVCVSQSEPVNVLLAYELGDQVFTVDENETNRFTVYPNPTADFTTVLLDENVHTASFILIDVNGKLIKTGDLEEQENKINLHGISAGIYILYVLEDGKSIGKQKIIKTP